jgi:hypothetical protein
MMAERLSAATGEPAGAFLPLPHPEELAALEQLLAGPGPVGRAWRGSDRFRSASSRRWALRCRLHDDGVPAHVAEVALAALDLRMEALP